MERTKKKKKKFYILGCRRGWGGREAAAGVPRRPTEGLLRLDPTNEAARKIHFPFLLPTPSHLLMPIRKKSKDSPHTVNTASTQWEQQQRLTRAQAPPPPCPRTSCLLVRGSNSSEVIRRLPACKKWREKPRSVWYPRWHLHAALHSLVKNMAVATSVCVPLSFLQSTPREQGFDAEQ